MWKRAGLRGGAWLATVLFCQTNQSWGEGVGPIFSLLQSGGSAVLLFSFCFINPLTQENAQSADALLLQSPAFPFIQRKHSRLLLFTEQMGQWRCINIRFPCPICRVYRDVDQYLWLNFHITVCRCIWLSEIFFWPFSSLRLEFQCFFILWKWEPVPWNSISFLLLSSCLLKQMLNSVG